MQILRLEMQNAALMRRALTFLRVGGILKRRQARRVQESVTPKLTGVAFDDQRFIDFRSDFVAGRSILEGAFELLRINRNPSREAVLLSEIERFSDANLLLGLFADGDDVAGADGVGRNVDLLAVHQNGAVAHELTRFSARGAEAHAVNDVVKTALEELDQLFTGVAAETGRLSEIAAELTFENAIHTLA